MNLCTNRRTPKRLTRTAPTIPSSPSPYSSSSIFAPRLSMSPFLIPWSPRLLRPLTAPSRVPRSFPGSNNDSKSVLVRRSDSEGYVAPCCWRSARRISAALPRSVGGFEGSEEVRRIERRGGRIWCSYIIQSSVSGALYQFADK